MKTRARASGQSVHPGIRVVEDLLNLANFQRTRVKDPKAAAEAAHWERLASDRLVELKKAAA